MSKDDAVDPTTRAPGGLHPEYVSEDDLWHHLRNERRVEAERLELKGGPGSELKVTIPAMAMTDGGLILLGFDDEGRTVRGCRLSQGVLDRIKRVSHEVDVDVQVSEITVAGEPVVVLEVPAVRDRVVTTPDGRLVRRVGGDDQPLRGEAHVRFVVERAQRSEPAEDQLVEGEHELDVELLERALAEDERPALSEFPSRLHALEALRLAGRDDSGQLRARLAGIVAFGLDPTTVGSGLRVQVTRHEGVGPQARATVWRRSLHGPIARVVTECIETVEREFGTSDVVIGLHRESFPPLPEAALREVLVNALAHRDLSLRNGSVDLTIWDDRIEVRSPGPLPGHITLDNMEEDHYSRNPRVMATLKLLRLVEEFGEGVDRVIDEMSARLMDRPQWTATDHSVSVVLRRHSYGTVEDQAWIQLLAAHSLTLEDRRALVIARREGRFTKRRLRDELGPEVDEDSLVRGLVTRGLVEQRGTRGGTHYVLSREVVLRAGASGVQAQQRERQLLLDAVRERGSLSTREAASVLQGADRREVRDILNDLAADGLVVARGRTSARRYHAD